MRSEKKQEARSVNPVQAQIKSLSGAILTIIDATYADSIQREAVKSLIKAQFRNKMDLLTLDWITDNAPVHIHTCPKCTEELESIKSTIHSPVWSASGVYDNEYTEEERKRLKDLEEEVVEVDGIEFSKDALKEKVVVDGIEFEKEKDEKVQDHHPCVGQLNHIANELDTIANGNTPLSSHVSRANSTAEAEPNPFDSLLASDETDNFPCKRCEKERTTKLPKLKLTDLHTCGLQNS